MDDDTVLKYSKDLSLGYLERIKANVSESDGLYNVTIPEGYEQIFGGTKKRITFDYDVADTHSCELVVPGSNFLAIVLDEIKRWAPVTVSRIKRQTNGPASRLDSIPTHNCEAILVNSYDQTRTAVRFHFNVIVSSVKRTSVLRRVDIDLDTMRVLDFAEGLEEEPSEDAICEAGDPRIEQAYSRAAEHIRNEIMPMVLKYADLTKNDLDQEIGSVEQVHQRREGEIRDDLRLQKSKLREYDRKIANARTYKSRQNHLLNRKRHEERVEKTIGESAQTIRKLADDKAVQIGQIRKRYRPLADLALIAAQLYSYDSAKCGLKLKNDVASRQVEAVFIDPSASFVINCEVCGGTAHPVYLCTNSHAACESCSLTCANCEKTVCTNCSGGLRQCYICRRGACSDCAVQCGFCSELSCADHSFRCKHCDQNACFFCSDGCQVCSARFCDTSIHLCNGCQRRVCPADSGQCSGCGLVFCTDDLDTCAICNMMHCASHGEKCKTCEQTYDTRCVERLRCTTCKTMQQVAAENPAVRAVVLADPTLSKYKSWESSANTRFAVFVAKKRLGKRIIVYDKILERIVLSKRGGWL